MGTHPHCPPISYRETTRAAAADKITVITQMAPCKLAIAEAAGQRPREKQGRQSLNRGRSVNEYPIRDRKGNAGLHANTTNTTLAFSKASEITSPFHSSIACQKGTRKRTIQKEERESHAKVLKRVDESHLRLLSPNTCILQKRGAK